MSSSKYICLYALLFIIPFGLVLSKNDITREIYAQKMLNNMTSFKIIDQENVVQTFNQNGNHIEFVVLNSLIQYDCKMTHKVLRLVSESVIKINAACGDDEYKQRCKGDSNEPNYFEEKLSVDHWECVFSQAVHCGLCGFTSDIESKIYNCYKPKPLIKVRITINGIPNDVEITRNDRLIEKDNITISPIQQDFEHIKQLAVSVRDNSVYKGNICVRPGSSCYGDLTRVNDTVNVRYNVDVRHRYAKSPLLVSCIEKNNFPIENLDLTEIIHHNHTFYQDYTFGFIEVWIKGLYNLENNDCKDYAITKKLSIKGCYDCSSGYKLSIDIDLPVENGTCYRYDCDINGFKFKSNFVKNGVYDFNLYSHNQILKVSCYDYIKTFTLEKNNQLNNFVIHKITSMDLNSNGVLSEISSGIKSIQFFKQLKIVIFSVITIILGIPILRIVYLVYKIIKNKRIKKSKVYKSVICYVD